mmetsp:Transcript_11549/g.21835  ORF Transcript_11549/g.21835 Transcript_11549/m.21835 type:complete len:85 (+) Transcript_11549:100-354(+)
MILTGFVTDCVLSIINRMQQEKPDMPKSLQRTCDTQQRPVWTLDRYTWQWCQRASKPCQGGCMAFVPALITGFLDALSYQILFC